MTSHELTEAIDELIKLRLSQATHPDTRNRAQYDEKIELQKRAIADALKEGLGEGETGPNYWLGDDE